MGEVVQNADSDYRSLEITLTGSNNKTLKGVLNFTALDPGVVQDVEAADGIYDSKGAATFVVVVILVYGLSIVMMIGSLAKENIKKAKVDPDAEEKQIHRYLNQASDLREKGAKENYRQLKRNIISIVNKSPNESSESNPQEPGGPEPPSPRQDLRATALRSMLAVGSPWAAVAGTSRSPADDPATRRPRLTSESDSLQALLGDEESGDSILDGTRSAPDTPYADRGARSKSAVLPVVQQPGRPPRVSVQLASERYPSVHQYPKTAAPLQTAARPPAEHIPRSPIRTIPRVVVSDAETSRPQKHRPPAGQNLQPLDIEKARSAGNTRSQYPAKYDDSKIICDVVDDLQQDKPPVKLSMDAQGNIWILNPNPQGAPQQRLSPSPSTSTPGSIGYESLREASRSASPSPIPFGQHQPPVRDSSRERRARTSGRPLLSEPRDCSTPKTYVKTLANKGVTSGRRSPNVATDRRRLSGSDVRTSRGPYPGVTYSPADTTDDEGELQQVTSV